MRTRAVFLLSISLLTTIALPAEVLSEERWPGWLGPNRDGWVSEFQAPATWPKELKSVWQLQVGTGYGSPLLDGDVVYQHARVGEDEVVWCVDLSNGKVLWRQSYPTPFTIGGGAERHGKGPKSSPILADGRLFTFSITGVLSAWDSKTGKLLWQKDHSDRFEKGHPYWGASASPIVDGDRVIVHFGTDGKGMLIAHDTKTGAEIWSQGEDGPSYSSPLVVEIAGIRQIIDWNQRTLAGVESETGRLLWEHPFPQANTDQNMPTPTFHNGMIILGAENRGLHLLEPRLENGQWSVLERWYQNQIALDMASAVVNDNQLYGLSHYSSGRLFCVDIANGEILWQSGGRTGDNATFLAVPKYVIALIDTGELQILKAAGKDTSVAASYEVSDKPTWSPPVLLNDGFLIKDQDTLTRWSFE